MNRVLLFLATSIFGIFVGSQITEGALLVPYWKTLSSAEFYAYYAMFGPTIGRFYTVLTITAVLIPVSISIYCFFNQSHALTHALVSSFFTFLCLSLFYVYFKEANQQFYESSFTAMKLKSALETWENWHWLRVFFEILSLIFLILAAKVLSQKESRLEAYSNN